jgi:HlyD family secretion protein
MKRGRTLVYVAAGGIIAAAIAWALWPAPLGVEVATVTAGPLRVTVEGPGRTRVRDRFVVAAPAPGHLGRIALEAGDPVAAGQQVAVIRPATPVPIDDRSRREIQARLEGAGAAEAEARAALERARDAADLARREQARARTLAEGGSLPARDLDAADAAAAGSAHAVEMAESAVRRSQREREAIRAQLDPRAGPGGAPVPVRSPAAGRVLRVLQESEGPVAAGAPLLEIGDPSRLELRVDLLTTEAVRVRPGARVEIVRWGGEGALAGLVRQVEPSAFTKVSALGIEEQRVYVLVDPAGGPGWTPLGDGFAADARIVVSERGDALQVPAGALFRCDGAWAVFAVEGGRARLRKVQVGESSGDATEVTQGLSAGASVVLHPGDRIDDGKRVRPVLQPGGRG